MELSKHLCDNNHTKDVSSQSEDNNKKDKTDGCDDDRCMLHVEGDCFVVAKEYNGEILIHIRNYIRGRGKRFPTKHGAALNMSKWLVLETKREEINTT